MHEEEVQAELDRNEPELIEAEDDRRATLPCRQPVATANRIRAISTAPNRPQPTPNENT